jgi:hypothetical protein
VTYRVNLRCLRGQRVFDFMDRGNAMLKMNLKVQGFTVFVENIES